MVRRATLTIVAVMAIGLFGCGQGGTEADAIARNACDLFAEFADVEQRMQDGDMEAMADIEAAMGQLMALEQRANEAGISDAEMEAAIQAQCPEIVDGF